MPSSRAEARLTRRFYIWKSSRSSTPQVGRSLVHVQVVWVTANETQSSSDLGMHIQIQITSINFWAHPKHFPTPHVTQRRAAGPPSRKRQMRSPAKFGKHHAKLRHPLLPAVSHPLDLGTSVTCSPLVPPVEPPKRHKVSDPRAENWDHDVAARSSRICLAECVHGAEDCVGLVGPSPEWATTGGRTSGVHRPTLSLIKGKCPGIGWYDHLLEV